MRWRPRPAGAAVTTVLPDPIVKLGEGDGGEGRGIRDGRTGREAEVEREGD